MKQKEKQRGQQTYTKTDDLTATDAGKYRVKVTSTGNACGLTQDVDIKVNVVNAGTITDNQTICEGTTPAKFISTAVGTSNLTEAVITYRWEKSETATVDDTTTWTAITNETDVDYTETSKLLG